MSLALGSFNTSLKHFNFSHNRIGNGQLVDVILALSMHSQLEKIEIIRMNIGSNECTALSTLLRNTTKQLQTLWLGNNNIDDEGVDALVHAIGGSKLVELSIACNPTITSRGWKTVPTLLEMPESNVEEFNLP